MSWLLLVTKLCKYKSLDLWQLDKRLCLVILSWTNELKHPGILKLPKCFHLQFFVVVFYPFVGSSSHVESLLSTQKGNARLALHIMVKRGKVTICHKSQGWRLTGCHKDSWYWQKSGKQSAAEWRTEWRTECSRVKNRVDSFFVLVRDVLQSLFGWNERKFWLNSIKHYSWLVGGVRFTLINYH